MYRSAIESAAERARQLCFETYGRAPRVKVSGDLSARIPYIWPHLDYILFEVFKNAMRAVAETSLRRQSGSTGLPSVHVCICDAPGMLTLRISDKGGGLPLGCEEAVWQYGFTTISNGDTEASEAASEPPGVLRTLASRVEGLWIVTRGIIGHVLRSSPLCMTLYLVLLSAHSLCCELYVGFSYAHSPSRQHLGM
jgi:hypothetical protein